MGRRDLASDPRARVIVLVDGQNVYKECKKLFGQPHFHPHLLAEYLAGPRTANRVAVRFYTGRPNPNFAGEAKKASHLDRRLAAMSGMGVTVVTRPLRYHWDWGHQYPLPPPGPNAPPQSVTLTPWQRPQEKGIDLSIGLDTVEFLLTGAYDVAIIVSLDRDLCEIPTAIRNMKHLVRRDVRLEAAVPVPAGLPKPKTIAGFAMTHQVTPDVFALVRDDTDYTLPSAVWKPPVLPRDLAERRAGMP